MTVFIRFSPDGGRIGRIEWQNTWHSRITPKVIWGSIGWDICWPYPKPDTGRLGQLLIEIADNAAMAAKALQPAVQQAAEAIREFGRAMAAIDQSPRRNR